MNSSTLKVLVPIVLLMGGVFALTFFSIYTPPEEVEKPQQNATTGVKPLQFFSSTRRWLPVGGSLQDREFPGFFEPGENIYTASFWFRNNNAAPVRMQLRSVSCSTCSGGQVAPLPTDLTKQILQMSALSALPLGPAPGFSPLMTVPAAQMEKKRGVLKWQYHRFDEEKEQVVYEVPGAPSAADKWAEQWSILELQFKVRPGSRGALTTYMTTQVQGSELQEDEKFEIVYFAAPPFEIDRQTMDVGELTADSAPKTYEILVYSSTRKPADLPKIDVLIMMPPGVSGEPGPFVSAGAPIPIPEKQLDEIAIKLSTGQPQPIRVQSAFLLPITVSPKVGNARLDIGRIERLIMLTEGTDSKQIRLSGSMRGPLALVGAQELNFGSYSYADEQTVTVMVETDKPGVELALVPGLTQPKGLKLELTKQPDAGERGSYKLKATLPAKEHIGEIKDGVVVLEAKGATPQRLRIPVTGRGR